MENTIDLLPYIVILLNITAFCGILGYAVYCGLSKNCAHTNR